MFPVVVVVVVIGFSSIIHNSKRTHFANYNRNDFHFSSWALSWKFYITTFHGIIQQTAYFPFIVECCYKIVYIDLTAQIAIMCVDVVLQILGTTHYLNPVSVSIFNVYQTKLLTEKRGNPYVTCKDNKDHSHTSRTMATCFSLQFYLDRIVMVIKYLRLRLYSYTLPFHFNSKWNNLPIKKHIHTHIDERE